MMERWLSILVVLYLVIFSDCSHYRLEEKEDLSSYLTLPPSRACCHRPRILSILFYNPEYLDDIKVINTISISRS